MPFCPTCRTEYETGTTECADCSVSLVAELPTDVPLSGERLDIYTVYDAGEVDRVVAILKESGIEGLVRDHSSSPFPTNLGSLAERVIAVRAEETQKARAIIQQAIDDEVISSSGVFAG